MNTHSKLQSLLLLLKQHRMLLLPLIPLVLFLTLIIFLLLLPTPNTQPPPVRQTTPTSTASIPLLTPLPSNPWAGIDAEWEENPEMLPGFENKEERSDGTTLYVYTSQKPDRPNITIRNTSNEILFYREQGTTDLPLMKIPLIKETYGEPDEVIQGSTYYGPQVQIYFYETFSRAFVVNPETEVTYELQSFPPMSADEYLQRYKEIN